jgi:hypothetical protein
MADFLHLSSFTGAVTTKDVSGCCFISPHNNVTHKTTDSTNLQQTNKLKFTAQERHRRIM